MLHPPDQTFFKSSKYSSRLIPAVLRLFFMLGKSAALGHLQEFLLQPYHFDLWYLWQAMMVGLF
jgi:hypothetical protein